MHRRFRLLAPLLALAVLAAAVVACGGDDEDDPPPGQGGSNLTACAELYAFEQSLTEVQSLNAGSSAADVAEARDGAKASFANLQTAMAEAPQGTSDDIQNAYSKFEASIGALAGAQNPGQVEELIKGPVAEMNRAVFELRTELGCP